MWFVWCSFIHEVGTCFVEVIRRFVFSLTSETDWWSGCFKVGLPFIAQVWLMIGRSSFILAKATVSPLLGIVNGTGLSSASGRIVRFSNVFAFSFSLSLG